MAKAFSLVTWNVEHFKGKPDRTARVIDFLQAQKPDVFGLLEVEGKDVFDDLVARMPGYQFHITEGRQTQEVLVGVKRGMTAFFTQRVEFKSGNQYLRPGALLTLHVAGESYSILFLHTKSSTKPIGLGIRDDQFERAFKFKRKVLDKNAGGPGKANFIFLGDFNTMGMKYPYRQEVEVKWELKKLDRDAKKVGMVRLEKNAPATWWNGPGSRYAPSDLDHVLASEHLRFKQFSGAAIDVRGWPGLATEDEQDRWIGAYSDHGLLYVDVQKVAS
ncbi:MAG: endonuclease/exonuclease/phosphatase family protein [Sedimenticola sp.]